MDKQQAMEKLKQEIENCNNCGLCNKATHRVVGEGDVDAQIMFIGEAPGYHEDQQGRPFVGRAGQILDQLLQHINLKREQVYIANILKCRPHQNRNPTKEEIKVCTPFLNQQISIIQPQIIGCLGNFATSFILEKYNLKEKIQGISKIHGQTFSLNTLQRHFKIIPLFHPAVATYNINQLPQLKEDFQIIQENISKP